MRGHTKTGFLTFAAILLVAAGLTAGCGKKSPTAPSSLASSSSADYPAARAVVAGIIAQSPEVVDDAQFATPETATLDGAFGARAAGRSLRFWRTIDHVDKTFEFAFSDTDSTGKPTRAVVTVRKTLTGQFNLRMKVAGDSAGADSTITTLRKPLEDRWVRRLLFERVPHCYYPRGYDGNHRDGDHGDRRGPRDTTEDWRLVGSSGVQVTAKDAQTQIVSVRVQGGAVDSTITDPLAFFRLRGFLKFNSGDRLTLTVTTLRNDDEVILLLPRHRIRFTNNGDNTYTASLGMPREECVFSLRHIGVNALSRGTLFDPAAPYDSQAWLAPFSVRPYEMAAYLP